VIPGLSRLVDAMQRWGAKASIEVNHGGIHVSPRFLNGKAPLGPSKLPLSVLGPTTGEDTTKEVDIHVMDQALIDQTIERYVNAVVRCQRAGFEMVSIHGAHGHLPAQFASTFHQQEDRPLRRQYGNRARFAVELLTAIRRKVGNKMALEYRISGDEIVDGGLHVAETIEFIKMIEDKIDLIHISAGIIGNPQCDAALGGRSPYMPPMYNVERAAQIKKAIKIPVAVVGAYQDLDMAKVLFPKAKLIFA